MADYPEPQKTWNALAEKTIKLIAMHVHLVGHAERVANVQQDQEFGLHLDFVNESAVELTYQDIEIRLVGEADQVEFLNPAGVIDYHGKPRVHLHTGMLDAGHGRLFTLRCRARKNMATRDLKFGTGVYGILVPQGHYWKDFFPTM